jgi:oxygen-independent coproporphyrinogen-3 oxidase
VAPVLPPLSVYVHLPWCERKCPYCDFNSHEAAQRPEDAYVRTLLHDLDEELAARPALRRRPIHSVFIGGGTPSLFSGDAIGTLLAGLRQRLELPGDTEGTMEANPGSAERGRMAAYVDAGVNRFSLGIQSFHDPSLRALGRIHDSRDAQRAIAAARASGIATFNLDLMHGLPGQGVADGLADLDAAAAARAPHVSWYQLTIEANTHFYAAPPALPEESVLEELEEEGIRRLTAAGYERYEVSAWARPGAACRHNLNYWRFGDYLALGAGAHGKLTDVAGRVLRYSKTRQPEAYLGEGGTRPRRQRYLGADDLIGEFMLGALRLTAGFDIALFEDRTGLPFSKIADTVAVLLDEGMLERESAWLRPSPLGLRFLDDVVGRFFADESLLARSS